VNLGICAMPAHHAPAKLVGLVAPTPDEPMPYRVVVRRDGRIIRALPVGSVAEGHRKLAELLRREADL
jgi:hypothetical protein